MTRRAWAAILALLLGLSALSGASAAVESAPVDAPVAEAEADLWTAEIARDARAAAVAEAPQAEAGDIPVDAAHFPDEAFRDFVYANIDNRDGTLTEAECLAVTSIFCQRRGVADLTGIALFPNLEWLSCENNPDLTALDLRGNPALSKVTCEFCGLRSLLISGCGRLSELNCRGNRLTSIDLAGCSVLLALPSAGGYCYNDDYVDFDNGNDFIFADFGIAFTDGGAPIETLILPDDLYFADETVKVTLGKTKRLSPVREPDRATPKYAWRSGDPSVAVVDGEGVVTPVKKGTATVTATAANGVEASVDVKVAAPKPEDIGFEKKSVTVYLGSTKALSPVFTPAYAESKLTWSSDNKKVAKVNSKGVVTPVKKGTATVTVKTANGKKASIQVKVAVAKSRRIDFVNAFSKVAVGKKLAVETRFTPEYAQSSLTWSSSKKAVATVSKKGVVTGKKKGSAVIRVKTANGHKRSLALKVVEPVTGDLAWLIDAKLAEANGLLADTLAKGKRQLRFTIYQSEPFVVLVDGDGVIKSINIGSGSRYTLYGLYPSMSLAKAKKIVAKKGWKSIGGLFYQNKKVPDRVLGLRAGGDTVTTVGFWEADVFRELREAGSSNVFR